MAGLTFADFKTLIGTEIADDGTTTATTLGYFINMAAREAWNFASWPIRRARAFVNTVAPYTTGTVTVTNASTTLTGSGTTFTSAMVGRKFAVGGADGPWYEIAAYVSGTELTLAEAYIGDTASAQTYSIYEDEYALAAATGTISKVILHDGSRSYVLPPASGNQDGLLGSYPQGVDRPRWYTSMHLASGARQIRFGPYAPDAVYRVEYQYLATYTDMTGSATSGLPQDLDQAIIAGALSMAYRRDHFQRSQALYREFQQRLNEAWGREREVSPFITQIAQRTEVRQYEDWPVDLDTLEI